jgi:prepilin-type N-terminal cleavage/methylation domain-containing protein
MVISILYDNKTQRGFTLLEVMIALFLLAFGMLAAVSMQSTAINSNALASRNTSATEVAQMVMDDLLSVNADDTFWRNRFLTLGVNNYDRFPPYDGQTNTVVQPTYIVRGVGSYTATYTLIPNNPFLNMTRIEVRVVLNNNPNLNRFFLISHRYIRPY